MTTDRSDWRREQLRRTLDHWRDSDFDPYIVLSVPRDATQQQIIDAHRRWVAAYHPDRHGNDPIASELTKRVNASRDVLLGAQLIAARRHEEQRRRQEEARRQSERDTREQEEARNRRRQMRSRARRHRQRDYRPPPDTGFRSRNRSRFHLWIAMLALVGAGIVALIAIAECRSNRTTVLAPVNESISTPEFNPTDTPEPAVGLQSTETPSGLTESQLAFNREYALELINNARTAEGVNPVTLDDNPAAQSHAEDMLKNCFGGHWGSDGLKPYMRYTLAGGHQHSAENISGSDYCPTNPDRYAVMLVRTHLHESMEGLLESPGHRENILNPHHRKVNIGIAYQHPNFSLVQLFVGDYIEFDTTPQIKQGILTLGGTVKNGASLVGEDVLGVHIYFDPPVKRLTRGQLARTYCYQFGNVVAGLRPPLKLGWIYDDDVATESIDDTICPDPYEVKRDLPPPKSDEQAHELWQQAYEASQVVAPRQVTFPWITADTWSIEGQLFLVTADINDILAEHGNGVYTVVVWGELNGEEAPISGYSIFVPPLRQAQVEVFSYVTPTPNPSPTPISTNTPNPEPPTPTVVPTRQPTPKPSVTPTQILTADSGTSVNEISNARVYALTRINETRGTNGLDPFTLDNNAAAQSHAQDMRAYCFHSHWGSDGLKSYMRYTLSGGQQYSSVYISGSDYCPPDSERYRHRTVQEELTDLMDRLLVDPGYLDVILNPNYSRVSFGIADQQPNFWFVQRFLGDFIEYVELPNINNQILSLSGIAKNGARLPSNSFGISIDYDQTPHALTRGQLHHTSCGASGVRIGALREPPGPNRYYTSDTFTLSGTRCQDPYYVPADAPVATSYDDDVPRIQNPYENEAIWITATHWEVTDETFSVTANIGDLLDQHGNGVYTIIVWGSVNGEEVPISKYSIFIPPYQTPP